MAKKTGGVAGAPKEPAQKKVPIKKKASSGAAKAKPKEPIKKKRAPKGIVKPAIYPPEGMTVADMWTRIDGMLQKGVDCIAISYRLGVSIDALERYGKQCGKWGTKDCPNMKHYKARMRSIGDSSLHERQYDVAMGQYNHALQVYSIKPDTGMLIWLGKQRLNQRDKTDLTSNDEQLANTPTAVTVQIVTQPRADKRDNG